MFSCSPLLGPWGVIRSRNHKKSFQRFYPNGVRVEDAEWASWDVTYEVVLQQSSNSFMDMSRTGVLLA